MHLCKYLIKNYPGSQFRYLQNSRRQLLVSSNFEVTNGYQPGVSSVAGRNHINEDRFLMKSISESVKFFGVFDGHNGYYVSEFVRNRLVELIEKNITGKLDDRLFEFVENAFHISFGECQLEIENRLKCIKDFKEKGIIQNSENLLCNFHSITNRT